MAVAVAADNIDLLAAGASRLPEGLRTAGGRLAYAAGKLVVVVDVDTGGVVAGISAHGAPVRSIAMEPRRLVSSDAAGELLVHDLGASGACMLCREQVGAAAAPAVVAIGGTTVLTAGTDGVLTSWSLSGTPTSLRGEDRADIGDMFLPECIDIGRVAGREIVAVGGSDRKVRLFWRCSGAQGVSLVALGAVPGHRDWVRSVSFSDGLDDGAALLATGSNDSTARIWRLSVGDRTAGGDAALDGVVNADRAILDFPAGPDGEHTSLFVAREALLSAHTDQVTCVRWSGTRCLVTCSMDSSACVWVADGGGAAWTSSARLGQMGGANAAALGFFAVAVAVADAGDRIFASSFSGGIFAWQYSADADRWVPHSAPGGHADEVTDAHWDSAGRFAVSCSRDKTTRIWAPQGGRWAEMARPQVHGHSVFSVALVGPEDLDLVTAAEEKMARLFEAPAWFYGLLDIAPDTTRARAAELPALGLSNKPLDHRNGEEGADTARPSPSVMRDHVPAEDELLQGRLFPEMSKLYAHGNDLSCVASAPGGQVLATAARSNTKAQAYVAIWDVKARTKTCELAGHDLTVTALRFSDCAYALASASRDRSFRLYSRSREHPPAYELVVARPGAHARLLNCVEWLFGTEVVATGSRDKKVKFFRGVQRGPFSSTQGAAANRALRARQTAPAHTDVAPLYVDTDGWTGDETAGEELGDPLVLSAPVTALSWCASALAVGLEDGAIELYRVSASVQVTPLQGVPAALCAAGRIRALHWRPSVAEDDSHRTKQLLIGSEDHSVRIYSVSLPPS